MCDLVTGAVIKFRGARAFMGSHSLGLLKRAAGLEIGGGDAGRAKHVAPEFPFL
jgi:hypothetical protein